MAMTNFSNITDTTELKKYLDNPFRGSKMKKMYYHYTSVKSAKKILESRSLLFSRIPNMNDEIEDSWTKGKIGDEHFFCLCQASETFGMWAMYGGLNSSNNKYVKIGITKEALLKLIDSNKEIGLSARSVLYTDLLSNKHEESFTSNSFATRTTKTNHKNMTISSNDFAGYVKDQI